MICLTLHEAFRLWCRREGYSVERAAKEWGCTAYKVRELQSRSLLFDDYPERFRKWYNVWFDEIDMDPGEMIWILRRRLKLELEEVADMMGLTRMAINNHERGEGEWAPTLMTLLLLTGMFD